MKALLAAYPDAAREEGEMRGRGRARLPPRLCQPLSLLLLCVCRIPVFLCVPFDARICFPRSPSVFAVLCPHSLKIAMASCAQGDRLPDLSNYTL